MTDTRETRGAQIAKAGRLSKSGRSIWLVPSQSHQGATYIVDVRPSDPTCTCPDFASRQLPCKHVTAVQLRRRKLALPSGLMSTDQPTRATYSQDWALYNAAQQAEGRLFPRLLRSLCDGICMPIQHIGAPRLPLSDIIFAMIFKTYSTVSGRRATSDIQACQEDKFIEAAPHYNTIHKYAGNPEITPILRALLRESASPLADIEVDFAVDSTGFSSGMYSRWFDEKWGRERSKQKWVKAHVICGVQTHVITDAVVTDGDVGDAPMLPELVNGTRDRFDIREVSADKAYLSRKNFTAIEKLGAIPYVPFKVGTGGNGGPAIWNKMWRLYQYKREEFLASYHKRSNIETTFSMIKRKFGLSVRAKTLVAQQNEVLAKLIAHNLCVLVMSFFELGVRSEFWKDDEPVASTG